MKKLTIGKLYKITFLDHAIGIDKEVTCYVVGWLQKNTKNSILLSHWIIDSECEETRKENAEPTVIVKSAILKIREIK